MKDTILSILGLLILFFPTALKVWRDRNGVKHPDNTFPYFILLMAFFGGGLMVIDVIRIGPEIYPNHRWLMAKYSFVSWCLYASIFPIWINWVHLKNGVVEISLKSNLTLEQKERIKKTFKDWEEDWNAPGMAVYSYLGATRKEVFMHVVSHLSKSAWPDKTWWWRALGWKGRLVVNALILIGGLILYFSR